MAGVTITRYQGVVNMQINLLHYTVLIFTSGRHGARVRLQTQRFSI